MLKEAQPIDGSLHYKYIAKTGVPNEADASYVTLSGSKGGIAGKLYSISKAEGTIQFHRASWEEMPTQCHIVNTLAALEIKGYRDVLISKGGGGAMGQTRILR